MAASSDQFPHPRWNRVIQYGSSSFELRLNIPDEWPFDAGTNTINISIAKVEDGSALLAATAATLWNSGNTDTLAAAVSAGDSTFTLSTGVSSTRAGDLLLIKQSDAGPDEVVEVENYNASTKVVTTTRPMLFAHQSSIQVYGRFAKYQLDASTVATWPKGLRANIRWDSALSSAPDVHEIAEVRYQVFSTPGLEQRIQHEYPFAWELTSDDYLWVRMATLDEFFAKCRSLGKDANDLMDLAIAQPVVASLYNVHAIKRTNSQGDPEYSRALEEYIRQWELFASAAQWFDEDQDDAEDSSEVADLDWYPVGRRI